MTQYLRNPNSIKPIKPIPALLVLFTLLGIGPLTCLAQSSVEEFRPALRTKASFTGEDLSRLERGAIIIKLLPVSDKREVAVCGVARMRGTPDIIVRAFQESMVQQNNRSVLGMGRFSNPPTLADVEALSLENSDIDDLKRCTIGNCRIKISASMIERFQREVDWAASDYRSQATILFREILMEYVRDYRARGDAALIEYHDQRRGVSVRGEQESLLDRILYVNEFAPEFVSYLRSFPHSQLTNVESAINWTKLKFGLKPVIIVTHVATYKTALNNAQRTLIVSKQIYANHYFDSSLAVTAAVSFPKDSGVSESYLLYTNHSRADSLAGSFSRVKRGVIERETTESLNDLLQQTRMNVEIHSANQSGAPAVRNSPISDWLFRGTRLYIWLFVVVGVVFLTALVRRNSRRRQGRSAPLTSRQNS